MGLVQAVVVLVVMLLVRVLAPQPVQAVVVNVRGIVRAIVLWVVKIPAFQVVI